MNDNEKKSSDWKMIIGGIVLIAVLFVGVQFIFWALGEVIGQKDLSQSVTFSQDASAGQSAPEDQDAPSFCVYCGRALPESFEWGQFCPWCGEKVE